MKRYEIDALKDDKKQRKPNAVKVTGLSKSLDKSLKSLFFNEAWHSSYSLCSKRTFSKLTRVKYNSKLAKNWNERIKQEKKKIENRNRKEVYK